MPTPQKIELGEQIADFSVNCTNAKAFQLSDYRGKNLVLYFYPRDSTPGCTLEGQDFSARLAKFAKHNTLVFGISRDSIARHQRFKDTQGFDFELLSDEQEELCQLFDVMKDKNMYGKKVRGIERSTFLLDGQGVLRHAWRKVKVEGHAAEVLQVVSTLVAKA